MKKIFLIIALAVLGVGNCHMNAQKEQGFFSRLSVGISASTMGVGIDASTTLNRHFMLRAGVEIMPGFTFDSDVEMVGGEDIYSMDVNLKGDLKRTQYNLLLNIYPSKRSSFFICGGAYWGGDKLLKIEGQSQELKDMYTQYGDAAGVVIGDFKLPVDANGCVSAGIKVSNFRPYLGIGGGRAVPHKRIGFMYEIGLQFHGSPKVYSNTGEVIELKEDWDTDDSFSDLLDKLNVYPVIKFRLCGRIF